MGLELLDAGVSELHDSIAYDARDDDARCGECKEERFRFVGLSHDPFLLDHHLSFPLAAFHLRYSSNASVVAPVVVSHHQPVTLRGEGTPPSVVVVTPSTPHIYVLIIKEIRNQN